MMEPPEPQVRQCLTCGWLFVSPDAERIRRCGRCKRKEDEFEPTIARVTQVDNAITFHSRESI